MVFDMCLSHQGSVDDNEKWRAAIIADYELLLKPEGTQS